MKIKKMASQQKKLALFFLNNQIKTEKKALNVVERRSQQKKWLAKRIFWPFFFAFFMKKVRFFWPGEPKVLAIFGWPVLARFFFGPTSGIA